ncbi:hypothetical protein PLIIFM63780_006587 [Purpureocillium lilacinum]|nr:hypothetical protein PLIIFM63780_006587 [Purpureocillium lilacinum]
MFAISILDISVAAQKHQPAFEIEYSDDYRDNVEGEDMWEFGQILPLLLLVLPLTSFLDELLSSLTLNRIHTAASLNILARRVILCKMSLLTRTALDVEALVSQRMMKNLWGKSTSS